MERTELREIIHLYYGCECQYKNETGKVNTNVIERISQCDTFFKLVLRKISDMTESEKIELIKMKYKSLPQLEVRISKDIKQPKNGIRFYVFLNNEHQSTEAQSIFNFSSEQFLWLLKNGFDLFGLIESGQAIDKASLK